MIAYYLHSRRPETRDRARAIVDALGQDVVVSPYPAPFGWAPGWVVLTDDSPAALSAWLIEQRPAAVLVDGPAEHVRVATGAGCRVAAVVGPGADPFHALGPSADVVDVLVAPWSSDLRAAAPTRWDDRVVHVGAIGAAAANALARRPAPPQRSRHGQWRCVGLAPTASGPGPRQRWEIVTSTPGWQWSFSGERELLEDGPVWDALLRCDVVVCAPTPANLAAVAAAQVPAVLVLSDRPAAEHLFLAEAARGTAPAIVVDHPPTPDEWRALLSSTRRLAGHRWSGWSPQPGLRVLRQRINGSSEVTSLMPPVAAPPSGGRASRSVLSAGNG